MRSISVQDAIYIYRNELVGCCNPCRIQTPNGHFRFFSLLKAIQTDLIDLESIQAVILFGSIIVPHYEEVTRMRGFWKWRKPYTEKILQEPNDYDALIVVKEGQSVPKVVRSPLALTSILSSGYSSWFEDVTRVDALHLFATTENDFCNAVLTQQSEALNIKKDGVLLFGEIEKIVLKSPLKANWGISSCKVE